MDISDLISWFFLMCCVKAELKGVPVEMVARLVPEHARKQCPWLGL